MIRANRDEDEMSEPFGGRRNRRLDLLCFGATLLACVSCSSAPVSSSDGDGAVDHSEAPLIADSRHRDTGGPPGHGNLPGHGDAHGGPGHDGDGHGGPGHGGPPDHCGAAGAGGATGGGGATNTAGAAGTGGAQQGSLTVSPSGLAFDSCPVAQTVTITNTSAVPVTWHINGDFLSQMDITPTSSTLAAGEAIAVSVIPKHGATPAATLTVDADNAPSQSIRVMSNPGGTYIQIPPDIDFGNVPLGSSISVFIPIPSHTGSWSGAALFGPSQEPFLLTSGPPQQQAGGFGWTLTASTIFNPFLPLGPAQATFMFTGSPGPVCPPNTFTARAVIVAQ